VCIEDDVLITPDGYKLRSERWPRNGPPPEKKSWSTSQKTAPQINQ
jgi:hypothetical protein